MIYGTNSYASTIELSSLSSGDGSSGFVITGITAGDDSGYSVSSAGDVNNDGIDDLIIGALNASTMINEGESYVVFGQNTAEDGNFPANLDLNSLNGANGFTLRGAFMDVSGSAVSDAGDINGDGIDDFMIGTGLTDKTYVMFGRDGTIGETFDATFNLSDLDGQNGFVLTNSVAPGNGTGLALSSIGDINGDGVADILIGAPYADENPLDLPPIRKNDTGQSYVLFGQNTAEDGDFPASIDLGSLNGTNGFAINGIAPSNDSGISVSSAGDINGDGFNDLIIGARGHDSYTGETYVVFGKNVSEDGDFSATLNLSSLESGDGSTGFVIKGIETGDQMGRSVSFAGDLNNDGYGDIIIGAPEANGAAGESYVIFGMPSFDAVVDLGALHGLG